MDSDGLRYFNPHRDTDVWQNRLPHWQQGEAVFFVTFRLADPVPHSLLKRWEFDRAAWLHHHPRPWSHDTEFEYHTRFSGAMEGWLDAGHGSCLLHDEGCRRGVAEALQHFEGTRCHQIAWVIMPNHVHALFVLTGGVALQELVHSWKSYTSKGINALLGRRGVLWQKDYFDRLVRDGRHLDNCIRYIRRNPAKAKLREGQFTLCESEFAKAVV
jgi:REP element-mobilizing transposase RayT